MVRKAKIQRKTNEVDIRGKLVIDGSGKTTVSTGFGPLDHILTLFAFHGFFDLELTAKGDLAHHIIEDLGIALGKAFKEALGNKKGISRYGSFSLVMDETLVEASVDISGRPVLRGRWLGGHISDKKNSQFDDTNFSYEDAEGFLKAFIQHAGISLVYLIKSEPEDLHHLLEALFKALGRALDQAVKIDPRRKGVPSTKGIID